MVNKCSVVGCRSRYNKNIVKVHRFPLENKTTLPFWIAITGKEPGWTPTQSSRLCCNHFVKLDYMLEHKKGVLKPTAVPSIKYKVNFPQFRKINTKLRKKNPNSSSNCDDDNDKCGNNHNEIMQYENSSMLTKYWIVNLEPIIPSLSANTNFEDLPSSRNNFTSINNYTESIESSIVISPTENHNRSFVEFQNTKEEEIKNSIFNKIMTLKLRCTQTIYSLYFKSPKIRRMLSQEESINSLIYTDDTDTANSGSSYI